MDTFLVLFGLFLWFAGLIVHPIKSILVMISFAVVLPMQEYSILEYLLGCAIMVLLITTFTTKAGLTGLVHGHLLFSGKAKRALDKIFD